MQLLDIYWLGLGFKEVINGDDMTRSVDLSPANSYALCDGDYKKLAAEGNTKDKISTGETRQETSNFKYSDKEKGWTEEHITGAKKEVKGKLRMDLIPPEALDAMAEVLTFGASKYSDRNWEKGLQYEKHHLSAMYRHINKWRKGIDNDEESGYNHMKHAMWHIMAIVTQIERGRTDLDDRVLTK